MSESHTPTTNDVSSDLLTTLSELDGYEQLLTMRAHGIRAPMLQTLKLELTKLERGQVVFEGSPDHSVYNPIGTVHGGYAATLLDSACGIAVHSRLRIGQTYTTLELKVAFQRALTQKSGTVRADGRVISMGGRAAFAEATLTDGRGRLCASATSTLLIYESPARRKAEAAEQ
ncbi:PaaI family thioesterase [Bradyrhizobium sp. U531]|uniref:PaaI family thioesterase n=1 Tax=Bradyrhizobium sp. U531 TaxID=3053458 RepID=UPI003F41D104